MNGALWGALALTSVAGALADDVDVDLALPPKMKYSGMSFTDERYCPNISMGGDVSHDSLRHLATTGTNYVGLVVTQYATNINDTTIWPIDEPVTCTCTPTGFCKTVTDHDLVTTIRQIHGLGMSIMLKPHIDLIKDLPMHWRGNIGQNFSAHEWTKWFENYERFILHYARIAEEHGVEMLAVSTELIEASKQEAHWRHLVPKIRHTFSGTLTSAANWSPPQGPGEFTDKKWWDLMDVMGCDQYYLKSNFHLIDGKFPTLAQLAEAWAPMEQQMERMHAKWGKPVIFTEMGYCMGYDADCFANNGGKETAPPNATSLETGANQYEAALVAMTKYSWFEGIFWWNWNTGLSHPRPPPPLSLPHHPRHTTGTLRCGIRRR